MIMKTKKWRRQSNNNDVSNVDKNDDDDNDDYPNHDDDGNGRSNDNNGNDNNGDGISNDVNGKQQQQRRPLTAQRKKEVGRDPTVYEADISYIL